MAPIPSSLGSPNEFVLSSKGPIEGPFLYALSGFMADYAWHYQRQKISGLQRKAHLMISRARLIRPGGAAAGITHTKPS